MNKEYIQQLIDRTADENGVLPEFKQHLARLLIAEAMEAQRAACAEALRSVPEGVGCTELQEAVLNAEVDL